MHTFTRFMTRFFQYAIALLVILLIMYVPAEAQPEEPEDVKYCQNMETGEIIVVRADMPCPYPTAG